MITDEELVNEDEVREILDDAKTECAKYGTVTGVLLLKAGAAQQGAGAAVDGAAGADKKIFVRFATHAEAAAAAQVLHGKKFDGRVVEATFHPDSRVDTLATLPHHTF